VVKSNLNLIAESDDEPCVEGSATILNAGRGRLHVRELRVSCGCSNAELQRNLIEPGDSTVVRIRVCHNGSNKQGTVTLVTNDPDRRELPLQFVCQIEREVAVNPKHVLVPKLMPGEMVAKRVGIALKGELKFEDLVFTGFPERFVGVDQDLEGSAISVVVQAGAEVGSFQGGVKIEKRSSGKPQTLMSVPVVWEVSGGGSTIYPMSRFANLGPDMGDGRKVSIWFNSNVDDFACNSANFSVNGKPLKARIGKQTELAARVDVYLSDDDIDTGKPVVVSYGDRRWEIRLLGI
jgi:hypothetical protein